MSPEHRKIALVADWITHWGGAERVFAKLMEMYPEADIYTSVYFPERPEVFVGRKIHTSFIQYLPFLNRRHKLCMLLRPLAFSRFDFSKYDLVISASSAEAKGIRTDKCRKVKVERGGFLNNKNDHVPSTFTIPLSTKHTPIHICYCHTPTRYLWSHSEQYKNFLEFGWLNWLAKIIIPTAFRVMKKWDYQAAQRPDAFIANSLTTQSRIAEFYDRESVVVYPFFQPVSVTPAEAGVNPEETEIDSRLASFAKASATRGRGNDGEKYYVCLGRIVPYKRFDLAIDVCNQLGLHLKIFTNTNNSESERLRKLSGPTIEWIQGASDEEVAEGLQHAQAFIMPQVEDFGIVALEAMSHGTPVIAYGEGGATETVIHGQTGLLFSQQTVESLGSTIVKSQSMEWDTTLIRDQSMRFSEERFETEFQAAVENVLN